MYEFLLTMHKFEQLVDNRLEKLPMGAQEPRVLANHIHDIGSDNRLVIFASLLLAQPQQILLQKRCVMWFY